MKRQFTTGVLMASLGLIGCAHKMTDVPFLAPPSVFAPEHELHFAELSPLDRHLHQLLNSDHPFTTGSSDLHPKYVGHLAEAAMLLKNLPIYQLSIIGHADNSGSARAQKIQRYLQILGLPPERIHVSTASQNHPLRNRRVTIELTRAPDQHKRP